MTPLQYGFAAAYVVWSALMIVGLYALVSDARRKIKSITAR